MTLAPLLSAGPIVITHVVAAGVALGLGILQFVLPKGTKYHALIGWTWVALVGFVAVGSFGIHTIRQVGPFSAIHLLSLFTLGMLVLGILHAKAGRIEAHRWTMIGLFAGALVTAGLFTLVPGRIMHAVLFSN